MRARIQRNRTASFDGGCNESSSAVTCIVISDDAAGLLQRSARGDREAFSQLYDIMCAPVYAVILNHTTDVAEAEQLLLDVFLGLWERCSLYPERRHGALSWILAYTKQVVEYTLLKRADEG